MSDDPNHVQATHEDFAFGSAGEALATIVAANPATSGILMELCEGIFCTKGNDEPMSETDKEEEK